MAVQYSIDQLRRTPPLCLSLSPLPLSLSLPLQRRPSGFEMVVHLGGCCYQQHHRGRW